MMPQTSTLTDVEFWQSAAFVIFWGLGGEDSQPIPLVDVGYGVVKA